MSFIEKLKDAKESAATPMTPMNAMNEQRGDDPIISYYDHTVGTCTKVGKDAIVWIPKCGSSVLRLYDPTPVNYYGSNFKKYWVLLRDPYFRWKSGICQYWRDHQDKEEEILDTLNKIEFDRHTVPQTKFLTFIGPAQFFMLEFNGLELLNKHLKLFKTIPKANVSSAHISKLVFSKKLDSALSKPLINKVNEYYHNDYMFIKNNALTHYSFDEKNIYYKG
jgi:hypothetical protein